MVAALTLRFALNALQRRGSVHIRVFAHVWHQRVPVTRTPIPQITPKAIELFRQYRRSYGKRSDDLHYALWEELGCKPWEWPCCEDPRADVNPYPPGTPAHATWQPNLRAQEMWKQLDAASREAKKAERETRKAAPSPPPNQPPEPPAA